MTKTLLRTGFILWLAIGIVLSANAQSILNKKINVQVTRLRLDHALKIISINGNFYFSYNSSSIKRDSLVSINLTNKTVREVLNYLFNNRYEYIENSNYIILRRKAITIAATIKQTPTEEKHYYLTGYIVDEFTGERIQHASIYEPTQLTSNLTDEKGVFSLKLKSRYKTATITISKESYKDTILTVQSKLNQQIIISLQPTEDDSTIRTISPEDYSLPDTIDVTLPTKEISAIAKADTIKVQKSWIGKFFLSTKQKAQSINLRKFFTTRAFQLSLVPGLSTQGKLSPQITTAFSVNVLGGYTGGVSLIELGGVFNIAKKNVQYLQAAGVFNLTGGNLTGVQLAGVHNQVLGSANALQAAGVSNYINGKSDGLQMAGVYNHTGDTTHGMQIAGVANFSKRQMSGVQIAGVLNYAQYLRGVQFGLINIADSSDGYSIGLINLVRKNGYRKISISTNEVTNLNIAFRSGNKKMYSAILAGANLEKNQRLYSFGLGLGKDIKFNPRFLMNIELSSHQLYAGTWDYMNLLNKFSLNFQWQPVNNFSVYAGPSFSVFASDQKTGVNGYMFPAYANAFSRFDFSDRLKGWIGFTAGVNLF